MAKWIADDVYISVNGTPLSDHIDAVDVSEEYPVIDVTCMGATAMQKVLGKAKNCTITCEFINDFAASQVFATLKGLAGSNTAFTVIARPTSATASSTNPQATMMSLLPKWNPFGGQYGQPGKTSITFESGDQSGIVWSP